MAHADPETIAAAIAPDNTDEMRTRVERFRDDGPGDGGAADETKMTDTAGATETTDAADVSATPDAADAVVVTTIERDSTSGLHSTVDDTLVNLAVADRVATLARGDEGSTGSDDAAESTRVASTDDRPTTDTTDTS